MDKIRVGIVGYGNIGKGAEKAIAHNPDFELVAKFTRRDPDKVAGDKMVSLKNIADYADKIDILLMCGGSAKDLPEQVPELAKLFNTVDTFDTHAKIPAYFAHVDEVAKSSGKLAMISTGWDPGLFSLQRVLMESAVPTGAHYTFWGKGVSQGHSDAIRKVPGVLDARQYTVPVDATVEEVREGLNKTYTARQMHTRHCYVVAAPGADQALIEQQIKQMPNYFEPYDTFVTFVDQETLEREHGAMPHGGIVIRSGITGAGSHELMEFKLTLDSNPEFTSSVMVAFARAAYRLWKNGVRGCVTPFDVPAAYLSAKSPEELRKSYL